jgi:oligogalacturonide transporter
MAVMVYSFFITPASGRASVFIFGCAMGLATGGVVVMIYAIFPDLPDVDELVTGMRREGVYAGLLTFMRKLSSALAIFLISQAISLAGYVPPVSETIDGVTKLVQQPQSGAFLLVLRAVFAAVPMVLLVFCLFFALRFPLSPQVHARLKDFLAHRRAGAMTDELAAEEKRLKDILV